MPIPFSCPHCGRTTQVDDQYVGQSGPCAGCGQTVTVPGPGGFPASNLPPATGARDTSGGSSTSILLLVAIGLLCTCLTGGGILVALMLPAVTAAPQAARRMACSNNLKQIGLALHNYHDVHGCLPAGFVSDDSGAPAHSWRVAILPFLGRSDLYDRYDFDEPWDGPHNQLLAGEIPSCFVCPACPSAVPPAVGLTNYVVILGDPERFPETMFSGDRWIKLSEVTDGTSNTLAVVEVANPVPWMQPGADLNFRDMDFSINGPAQAISSAHVGGASVLFADGAVRFLGEGTPQQSLLLMVQPTDGQVVPMP